MHEHDVPCLAQVPVGNTASSPPAPPSTLPNWWADVRDSSNYANIPGTTAEGSTTAKRDQALQNSFSFIRGNRDPVVQSLKISSLFDSTHTTCASLAGHVDSQGDSDSPCYYGEILGDVFHGNPAVVSFPNNVRYYQAQDPKAANFGVYSDRGASYQTFFTNYRHRRKIIYAGGNDGFLHAIDAGVYNGDTSSYTVSGVTTTPLLNHYDLGSGREIFGYAPSVAVQKFYQLAHTIDQDWTVDGPPLADDVYIDVTRVGSTPQGIRSSDGCATPPCSNITGTSPAWRTVVISGEREGGIPPTSSGGNTALGGGSVFALDVTDPDLPAHMDAAHNGVKGSPECLVNASASTFVPGTSTPPAGCNAPYPRVLWEFVDNAVPTANAQTGPTGAPAATNEAEKSSGNAESTTQDLGYTWSRPTVGRIKVKDTAANQNRDLFVAIFGGGYRNISANQNLSQTNVAGDTGNFLYMVDIETGKVMYKRDLGIWTSGGSGTNTTGNLEAGLPGDPSVIDLNQDGYIDYIYEGDTQGRVWKIDLTTIAPFTSGKIAALDSGNNPVWAPKLLFDEYSAIGSIRRGASADLRSASRVLPRNHGGRAGAARSRVRDGGPRQHAGDDGLEPELVLRRRGRPDVRLSRFQIEPDGGIPGLEQLRGRQYLSERHRERLLPATPDAQRSGRGDRQLEPPGLQPERLFHHLLQGGDVVGQYVLQSGRQRVHLRVQLDDRRRNVGRATGRRAGGLGADRVPGP